MKHAFLCLMALILVIVGIGLMISCRRIWLVLSSPD